MSTFCAVALVGLACVSLADAKMKGFQRAQLRAYCLVACQREAPPTPGQHSPLPYTTTAPKMARVKACMHGTFTDWFESTVCPPMCRPMPNVFDVCDPDIVLTTSCGQIAVCRGRVDGPDGPGTGGGVDSWIGTLTCAAGVDRVQAVKFGPGLPFAHLDCTGSLPNADGSQAPSVNGPAHIVCRTCCPQGTDFPPPAVRPAGRFPGAQP